MFKTLTIIGVFLLSIASLIAQEKVNQFDTNGKRHGVWKKNYKNTNVLRYEGEFNHGKETGTFKFYKNVNNKPSLTATRTFNENNNIAEVTFFASNGKIISQGNMLGKKYIGIWKYFHNNSNQVMTIENYNNDGKLEGESIVYYLNGQIAEKSHFKDGKLHGQSLWYDEDGTLIKEYNYINDELYGKANFYGPEGKLKLKGQYKNNRRDGVWTYYKKNGEIEKEEDFTRRSKNPYKQH
ncbi:toxin-antitoxin system YwqK family antitoxin [Mangrovimonas spongiae]|uniref:Toxin-antitoxin system YwqK family antitoxin n=1 Tax=Mangrovimonas spongiae TaxID=2494697 RepID=A0A428K2D5_9FLAO|nr:toxin-antitoxin system YwqK family antitoxin [Mangrovimonas spongiae]RSK40546.1 toxin-antitoxin system YwqK family antitoxin [Mangrovimonas spongiae]